MAAKKKKSEEDLLGPKSGHNPEKKRPARGCGPQFICAFCQERLAYIGEDRETDDKDKVLYFKCRNCDEMFAKPKPEDWIDRYHYKTRLKDEKALLAGTSCKQDKRLVAAEIAEVIDHMKTLDPQDLTPETMKALVGTLVVSTFLYNLTSVRPSIRNSAAKELKEMVFEKPVQRLDVTSKDEKLTGEALVAKSEKLLAEYQSLLKKQDEPEATPE